MADVQKQLGVLLEQLHTESSESKNLLKFSDQVLHIALSLDKLADNLSSLPHSYPPAGSTEVSNVDEDLSESEESDVEEGILSRKIFNSGLRDDWDTAQKLIAGGCDPLPRRRCFSRTPPHYNDRFNDHEQAQLATAEVDLRNKVAVVGLRFCCIHH
ncbi:hypothetical protein Q3G72_018855 [Acer saccharum]|nr:hypothetical protein Q3G72_018855 [Acer saccharum]